MKLFHSEPLNIEFHYSIEFFFGLLPLQQTFRVKKSSHNEESLFHYEFICRNWDYKHLDIIEKIWNFWAWFQYFCSRDSFLKGKSKFLRYKFFPGLLLVISRYLCIFQQDKIQTTNFPSSAIVDLKIGITFVRSAEGIGRNGSEFERVLGESAKNSAPKEKPTSQIPSKSYETILVIMFRFNLLLVINDYFCRMVIYSEERPSPMNETYSYTSKNIFHNHL